MRVENYDENLEVSSVVRAVNNDPLVLVLVHKFFHRIERRGYLEAKSWS